MINTKNYMMIIQFAQLIKIDFITSNSRASI